MTHVHEVLDPLLLADMVEQRYINTQTDGHLTIWNYGQRAQFDNVWNDATLTCRGLITDPDGTIVARPFRKFFNLSQLETIPDGPFTAADKMDGSLGIIYRATDGLPAVATRGSFISDQAQWATAHLRAREPYMAAAWEAINHNATLLVEIVYPANRIVVDYGDFADLIYIGAIDNATGADVRYVWPGPRAEVLDGLDIDAVMALEAPNTEGFVLRWNCGTRAKVKFAEYLRLHKLLTGVNARTIWELLAAGQALDELVELVPDEFHQWVQGIVADLTVQYDAIESKALVALTAVDRRTDRREQAAIITATEYPGITFAMLDGKPHAERIWRLIKPEATRPFMDGEA